MSIDSFYILNSSGEILIEKNYKFASKRTVANSFYKEYFKNKNSLEGEYPLIKIEENFCSFLISNDLLYLAVFIEEQSVLTIYNLLYMIIEILKQNFKGTVSTEQIRQNYSSILIMVDHFLDFGFPLVTHKHVLESMIKSTGVLQKIEGAIGGRTTTFLDNAKYLEKYTESLCDVKDYSNWRIPDLKESEEIYFDVIEYADCIMEKSNKYLHQDINGEIKVNCSVSGIPEVNLFLHQPKEFFDYSVHECLYDNIEAFERERVISVIPQNGIFTLFYYNIKNENIKLPFEILHNLRFLDNNVVEVDIKVEPRYVAGVFYQVEDFHLKMIMPKYLILNLIFSGLLQNELNVNTGIVNVNDSVNNVLWKLGDIKRDSTSKLFFKGTIKEGSFAENKNFSICLKFQISGFSFSGTSISKVVVKNYNEKKNLIKKARNIAKSGYFEIRLNY